jgi:hypothetical protein
VLHWLQYCGQVMPEGILSAALAARHLAPHILMRFWAATWPGVPCEEDALPDQLTSVALLNLSKTDAGMMPFDSNWASEA